MAKQQVNPEEFDSNNSEQQESTKIKGLEYANLQGLQNLHIFVIERKYSDLSMTKDEWTEFLKKEKVI